jgi:hypothetical protein
MMKLPTAATNTNKFRPDDTHRRHFSLFLIVGGGKRGQLFVMKLLSNSAEG